MTNLTLFMLLALPLATFAQKKAPVKPATKTNTATKSVPVLSEEDKIKVEAEKWFKNVFVETTFKDPYSYKNLKTLVSPVSFEQTKIDEYDSAGKELAKLDTTGAKFRHLKNMTSISIQSRDRMQKLYDDAKSEGAKKIYKQSIDRSENDYQQALSDLQLHERQFETATKNHLILKESLSKIDPSIKDKIVYYRVFIDCYAKNSYGGEVLGKYVFKWKDGKAIDEPFKFN